MPPAVLNFMVAEQYRQEPAKVASIVLIGNAMAVIFVPIGHVKVVLFVSVIVLAPYEMSNSSSELVDFFIKKHGGSDAVGVRV